ncbi:aspartate/glutamate racemase family protein [Paenibacillus contaminans]|uniref:Aspartate/glutamate racemase family protein n=1 Tax=Paenibacillus contaminans TaxID=450362 RepID=A0A329MAI3_9BACL|nr:aspartate/glutamate racemase family protein [Paenibacillus contaminans]RAV15563.1 aspartate/glutamate racemase family protein [Paenibacillus contaminans]
MKIKMINPNTTVSLTQTLQWLAQAWVRPTTELIAVSPPMGPASIESYYDDHLAAAGVFHEIARSEQEDPADGYVIACFGEPGLWGARELTSKPVLGIAEAAMHMASMLSPSFTILSALNRSKVMMEQLVYRYGMERKLRSVRPTSISVLDIHNDPENSIRRAVELCRKAVEEDGAESVILGCASLSLHREAIEREAGIPVIDGLLAAVKFCEAFAELGARTSKVLTFAKPQPKAYAGILRDFGNPL